MIRYFNYRQAIIQYKRNIKLLVLLLIGVAMCFTISNPTSKQYAVFSINEDPNYNFFGPIVAFAWKRLGFTPCVIATDSVDNLVIDRMHQAGAIVFIVPSKLEVAQKDKQVIMPSSNIAQTGRLFVSASPFFKDDDYIVTSDSDMIPLSYDYFHGYDPEKSVNIFEADPDAIALKMYLICYIGMKAKVWREILDIKVGSPIHVEMKKVLDSTPEIWITWGTDQELIYNKIESWRKFDNNKDDIELRRHPMTRLDRNNWRKYDGKNADCHILRPGYQEKNWDRIKSDLLELIFPESTVTWLTKYRNQFCSFLPVVPGTSVGC